MALRDIKTGEMIDISRDWLTGDRAEEVVLEFKARQRWTTIVTTLRRSAFLAQWTAEHMEAIFGQVDSISAQRAKPTPKTPADAPEAPEPSSPPAVTDPEEPS